MLGTHPPNRLAILRSASWPTKTEFAARAHTLADVGIRHTWRDVGPCRVRLASLADGADFQLFLTDDEQFANCILLWPTDNRNLRDAHAGRRQDSPHVA